LDAIGACAAAPGLRTTAAAATPDRHMAQELRAREGDLFDGVARRLAMRMWREPVVRVLMIVMEMTVMS